MISMRLLFFPDAVYYKYKYQQSLRYSQFTRSVNQSAVANIIKVHSCITRQMPAY